MPFVFYFTTMKHGQKFLFLPLLFLTVALSCQSSKQAATGVTVVSRYQKQVDSIMALMTLDEKIGQMTLFTTDWGSTGPTIREGYQDDIRKGRCGAYA